MLGVGLDKSLAGHNGPLQPCNPRGRAGWGGSWAAKCCGGLMRLVRPVEGRAHGRDPEARVPHPWSVGDVRGLQGFGAPQRRLPLTARATASASAPPIATATAHTTPANAAAEEIEIASETAAAAATATATATATGVGLREPAEPGKSKGRGRGDRERALAETEGHRRMDRATAKPKGRTKAVPSGQ